MYKPKIRYTAQVTEYEARGNMIFEEVEIFYRKNEAVSYCTNYVKRRCEEVTGKKNPSKREILQFSLHKEVDIRLSIREEGLKQTRLDEEVSAESYVNYFNDVINSNCDDLYVELLSFNDNFHRLNYIGQIMNSGACDKLYGADTNFDSFTEEECAGNVYKGKLKYQKHGDTRNDKNVMYQVVEKELEKYIVKIEIDAHPRSADDNGKRISIVQQETAQDALEYGIADVQYYMEWYVDDDVELSEEEANTLIDEKVKSGYIRVREINNDIFIYESAAEVVEQIEKKGKDVVKDSLLLYVDKIYDHRGNYQKTIRKYQSVGKEYVDD